MMLQKLVITLLLSGILFAQSEVFDLNWNKIDQALSIKTERTILDTNLSFSLGIVESYEHNSSMQNYLYHTSILYPMQFDSLILEVGGKLLYGEMDFGIPQYKHDISALAISANLTYDFDFTISNHYWIPFAFPLRTKTELQLAHSAIGATPFFKSYSELIAKLHVELMRDWWAYIGYRDIEMQYEEEDGKLIFEKGVMLGFKLYL